MKKRAGATGLEPAASGLTGQRDNQLRHAPVEEECTSRDSAVSSAATDGREADRKPPTLGAQARLPPPRGLAALGMAEATSGNSLTLPCAAW